jgi:BASS family bile acid:Na+ symporter
MKALERLSMLAGNYFGLLVILFSTAGFFQPALFTWSVPFIPLFLGIIMFGMGMTLTGDDFKVILIKPGAVIIGVLSQYTVMPLAALLIVTAFNLPPEIAVGVILVGTCPGGTASNVITYLSRGDVALSVSMTTVSTLLSPLITPLFTLWLAGRWIPVAAGGMFLSILKIVLLPVVLGILLNHFFREQIQRLVRVLPLVSVIAIVVIVGGIIGINAERMLTVAAITVAVVILHNFIGLMTGYSIGRSLQLDEHRRRTLAIEVGMQNSGLALTLALLHFTPAAALPAALFSVWHNVSGSLLASFWSRR